MADTSEVAAAERGRRWRFFARPLTPLRWLRWLVFISVAPAWAAAAWIIFDSYQQRVATLVGSTTGTSRALIRAVERDLAGAHATLEALTHSAYLAEGDLARFHAQARRMLERQQGNGIVLADPSGQQVMSTVVPWGTPLPKSGIPHIVRRIVQTGEPVAADFYIGATSKRPQVAVAVPVLRDGKVAYVLSMGFLPERLGEILRVDTLPPGSIAALLDGNGTIVARTHAADKFVGRPASDALLQRLRESSEGVVETLTVEGIPVLASYSRSRSSGWTVAIAIPKAQITAQLRNALWLSLAVAALLFLIGAFVPRLIALRIEHAIRADLAAAHEQSVRDPLTGLFNRRYLEETLERELDRVRRRSLPLAVVMLDVDHFKRINDTHGHDAGDAVLRALSRELAAQLRGSDIVCRYGGEEFVLVMPEASLEVACARADAARKAVAALGIAHAGAPVGRVTVSVGVAAFPQHGTRAEAIIGAADKALYAAKRAGRNRVVCTGGDAASGSTPGPEVANAGDA